MSKKKQEQFLALYEPIHDRFERFCRARVYGNMDFRDLINETLLIAFEKFETLKSSDAFLSFLFGISVRILANKNRKNKEDELKEDKVLFLIKDQHADSSKSTDIYFLHQALAQLSEDQREAIILFEITGFSIKEITEIQQVSESAVKQRLKRGREKLTEILTFESSLKTGEVQHG
ncbi:MAG: RNA polymerase sigma factor [Fluviicola sp.]|nr:RNA polymerase sigma factor [Fluviicola sp.]